MTLSDTAKDIVFSAIKFHTGKKYELLACVVMNTHAHCILKPLEKFMQEPTGKMPVPLKSMPPLAFHSLAEILHSIKSYSSNQININEKRKGSVWQDENYDRILRDEVELTEKLNYIINNPMKAGLVERHQDYKWLFCTGVE